MSYVWIILHLIGLVAILSVSSGWTLTFHRFLCWLSCPGDEAAKAETSAAAKKRKAEGDGSGIKTKKPAAAPKESDKKPDAADTVKPKNDREDVPAQEERQDAEEGKYFTFCTHNFVNAPEIHNISAPSLVLVVF